jgi:hypothetical protein
MKQKLLLSFALGLGVVQAAAVNLDIVQLESKYLGDGLFQYTLTFPDGRYFETLKINALKVPFANFAEFGQSPSNWNAGAALATTIQWDHAPDILEKPPYQAVLLARSNERTFRRSVFGEEAIVTYGLYWYPWASDTIGGALGFGRLNCLLPCPAAEADGSSPIYRAALPGPYPELKILSFVVSNDVPYGLNFSAGQFAVGIESSSDLVTWTNVGDVLSTAEFGTWLSPVPLPELGSFFRLRVGPSPIPPPVRLASASLLATGSSQRTAPVVPVGTIRVENGIIEVPIKTEAGRTYRVSLAGFDGQEKQVRTFTASSEETTVQFPDRDLPNPCYVKVVRR